MEILDKNCNVGTILELCCPRHPATPITFPDYFSGIDVAVKLRQVFTFLDEFYAGCLMRVALNDQGPRQAQAATNVARGTTDDMKKTTRDMGMYRRS